MSEEILALARPFSRAAGATMQEVFDASYRRLVVQLYAVTGDRLEAEDLVQDAFVHAAAAGNRFVRTDDPETWLLTTAIDRHRSRWRKARNSSRIQHRLQQPTDLPGLEDHLVVVRALRTLPEHQRMVLVLHHLAGLSLSEIAAHLGCPEGTVRSRLRRGRAALVAQLGSWEASSGE